MLSNNIVEGIENWYKKNPFRGVIQQKKLYQNLSNFALIHVYK